jgi:hypothetical protein
VFREPFGGFAAGVAGFEGIDADHAKTLDLETRDTRLEIRRGTA